MQLDSEVGTELAKHAAQTLANIAKLSSGIREIKTFGGPFTLFRALMKDNIPLKKVVVDCLVGCSSEAKYRQSFSSGKLVKLLVSLLKVNDSELANKAAKVIANMSDLSLIQEDLKLGESMRTL